VGFGHLVFVASGAAGDFGDAEVEDFDGGGAVGASCEKEVGGLEVAVDDARGVSFGEGFASLKEVEGGLFKGESTSLFEEGVEVGPFEVLHDHVGRAGFKATYVMDFGDVFAFEAGSGAGFAEEALDGFVVVERGGEHEFEGAGFEQIEVGSGDDDAHAACAKEAVDTVFAGEDISGLDGRSVHVLAQAGARRRSARVGG